VIWDQFLIQQESCAIAKIIARCALYKQTRNSPTFAAYI